MGRAPHVPEEKKNADIAELKFNDLMYSLETKTFTKFMKLLVKNDVFAADMNLTDPLPDINFDTIATEIKKRLAGFNAEQLENTKIWLRDPARRLRQLIEEERKRLGERHGELSKNELELQMKDFEKNVTEAETYRKKFEDLVLEVEKHEVKPTDEENIRKGTKRKFEQLHLFDI